MSTFSKGGFHLPWGTFDALPGLPFPLSIIFLLTHLFIDSTLEHIHWRQRTLIFIHQCIHWKDWCWSSNALDTWCEEPTHWKRPWSWERLKAAGKGGNRGWDVWMASPTQWTWVWANSRRWWRTGKPGATVHGVSKSWTWLSNWTTSAKLLDPEQCLEHRSCSVYIFHFNQLYQKAEFVSKTLQANGFSFNMMRNRINIS